MQALYMFLILNFLQDFDPKSLTFNLEEGDEGCSDGSSLDI